MAASAVDGNVRRVRHRGAGYSNGGAEIQSDRGYRAYRNALYLRMTLLLAARMTDDTRNLAILFADVAGSTRLYETLGDAEALAPIGRCLELVRHRLRGPRRPLIKTIGDEAMVDVSRKPTRPPRRRRRCRRGSPTQPPTERVRLAIRVGFNFGPAIEVGQRRVRRLGQRRGADGRARQGRAGDPVGADGRRARPVAALARAADRLADVKGKHDDIAIYELLWQDSEAELTAMTTRPRAVPAHIRLRHGATRASSSTRRARRARSAATCRTTS